ncbi:putative baseplate assembly protein [Variovorax sp. JS1663]|uniref:putative baseplate assembly protein n=1 Tax=Variovorax sp. JS1663 TaxID=1851577 RepID=UPI000B341624|nr:putative baseplate assembly protein [Variovorax sp. JS1663]OUL98510.1 putative baseplate assembly protein [Variovorax sp. JS1663]
MNSTMSTGWRCACGGRGCGCCEGIRVLTPLRTANRPGLATLHYRIGTHGSFFETMKARLSLHRLPVPPEAPPGTQGARPLAGLRVRDGSDPAIALLDACAVVGDILSFYQERIANEGYLRTATEMRSVFELARLVGYRPRPGVASSVYLAYTIDPNTAGDIVIPEGSRAQSVPGQDEQQQSFETSQDLKARAAWNRLGLRQTEPQQWAGIDSSGELWLAGTQTRLKVGDPLLIDPGETTAPPLPYRVVAVEPDAPAERTLVRIEPWEGPKPAAVLPTASLAALGLGAPQGGTTAGSLQKELAHLDSLNPRHTAFASGLRRLRQRVDAHLADPAIQRATRLRPWLQSLAEALAALPQGQELTPLAMRIGQLNTPPSKPLKNALQLPRSLATSFTPVADAGLKVLEATAPALKDTLAPAIAGYEAASPAQTIRVWAPRLAAGVFGRGFPRRTRIEFDTVNLAAGAPPQASHAVDDGEWPIAVDWDEDAGVLVARESTDTVYLDAAHGDIAPGSWVFVDAGAVPVFDKKDIMVRPAQSMLVTTVKTVFPKVARADYGGSGDSTGLVLGSAQWIEFLVDDDDEFGLKDDPKTWERDFQVIRRTAVYAQSEPLALAERPIRLDLCSHAPNAGGGTQTGAVDEAASIELDGLYAGLEAGRFLVVSGERADVGETRGVFASEAVMITSVLHDVRAAGTAPGPWTLAAEAARKAAAGQGGEPPPKLAGDSNHTFIRIDKPLAYCYRRETVSIMGNVVKASHGESRNETLGNGDGTRPMQAFELKQTPLTHLPAPTASGAESTLRVYVNDVRWQEVPGFFGHGATERIYQVHTDDRAMTTVRFGNGIEGTRLPTGIGNVKAIYRNGIGRPGNVKAGQIQQLATRQLGVKEVVNPLRASGGADRESRDQVRRNAPIAVKALDRLVSTPDYADFARCFAGIGKADAQELSDGRRSLVHVTVAGVDDIPIDNDSELLGALRRAMRDLGDPFQPVALAPRELRLLIASARLRIDPDRLWEPVVSELRRALLEAFGFDRRELAQGVASSEVLRVMQSVPGVSWVDLDAFGAIDTMRFDGIRPQPLTPAETADAIAQVVSDGVTAAVQARPARRNADGSAVLPAQLVQFSSEVPETLVLNQIK